MEHPEIGIVIFPGAQMAAVLGMTDLFTVANRIACQRADAGENTPLRLRLSHWQWEAGAPTPFRAFDTAPETTRRDAGSPTVLVIPPGLGAPLTPEEAEPFKSWLRDRHGAGATLGSICKGAFLLAETGLLNGRQVTTHWTYEHEFQARFPDVHVDTARLLVDDGDIITAGGVMAWTDLALRVVDRLLGGAVMLDTARTFLIDPPGREQSYYSVFTPKLSHGDAAILKVQHWLQETSARNVDLASLVAHSGLGERTFLRRFQKATGLTTTEYWQRLRVGRARELLQEKGLTGDQVAWEVGYADPGAFRKVFNRIVGLSPAEYRRRFRG